MDFQPLQEKHRARASAGTKDRPHRCRAKDEDGTHCRHDALPGSDYCTEHQPVDQTNVVNNERTNGEAMDGLPDHSPETRTTPQHVPAHQNGNEEWKAVAFASAVRDRA